MERSIIDKTPSFPHHFLDLLIGSSLPDFTPQHWLQQKPSEHLLDAWKGYITALTASANADVREKLKSDLLGRARHVAEIVGGILGFRKTSETEQTVLDSLESAFK